MSINRVKKFIHAEKNFLNYNLAVTMQRRKANPRKKRSLLRRLIRLE